MVGELMSDHWVTLDSVSAGVHCIPTEFVAPSFVRLSPASPDVPLSLTVKFALRYWEGSICLYSYLRTGEFLGNLVRPVHPRHFVHYPPPSLSASQPSPDTRAPVLEAHIDVTFPPTCTMLVHSVADPVGFPEEEEAREEEGSPWSRATYDRLRSELGVRTEVDYIPDAIHGLLLLGVEVPTVGGSTGSGKFR
ncbi:uncharacterized protein B0H18DRAFT_1121936 [Fomitopsis serialis]|uniref:uncharacterized protein n=1 Tax=Fomitopsis serialis TaxID=139415 RepID=UPI002007B625|nr:uncharacterized protein B0H18DRAFT_1121936 [Neoantrodia serialis]KAH9920480.1 hypothetical protein B0H18DRAFT_1121936 [Neoantrodia serialis]